MENLNNFLKPFKDNKIKFALFFGLECSFNNSEYELSKVLFTPNLQEAERFCKKLNKSNVNLLHYRVTKLVLELNN